MKKVSYIVPVKNRVRFVKTFFKNYEKTKVSDSELIVIDGASTDGTKELLEIHKDLIDIFISEPDASNGEAFNKGVALSSGEYIKTHSIDDIVLNINKPIDHMNQNQDIDLLVLGGLKSIKGQLLQTTAPSDYGTRCEHVFVYGSCGIGFLIRKSSFPRIGLFSLTHIANDREFALRAIKKGIVRFYPGTFYWHGVFKDSLGHTEIIKWQEESLDLFNEYFPGRLLYGDRFKYSLRDKGERHDREKTNRNK